MLISFTVENYRSFKDPVTLSMEATHLVGRDPAIDAGTIFEAAGHRLLTSAAVFGANASGKSNLARAFGALLQLVHRSVEDQDSPLPVEPYRLDPTTADAPTRLEVRLVVAGVEHRYGVLVTRDKVHGEWLYERPKRREVLLFRRGERGLEIGSTFPEGQGLQGRVRPNALFLGVVSAFNGEKAGAVRMALMTQGAFANADATTEEIRRLENLTTWHLMGSGGDRALGFVTRLLRDADTGISGFEVEEGPKSVFAVFGEQSPRIRTFHDYQESAGPERVAFDLGVDESAGTRRLFAFAGLLYLALELGTLLVIDELDARLHPNLTRKIVELFHSPETNPKHAQLVCTTHDTNLLTPDLFRRDQIWFVEKGSGGQSELYSLAEIKGVREDAAWERAYLAGKFGAVPVLNRFGQGLDVRGPK